MAEYIEYHPLKFWLDPASIAEIVAHIQTYLVNNPINSTTEIETIIHDYLIAHPELIGGVESVNGETGEVVLTADNISAGENVTIKDVLDSLQDQIDDIVASIPSDYQQLINDVSDLKTKIDEITDTDTDTTYTDITTESSVTGKRATYNLTYNRIAPSNSNQYNGFKVYLVTAGVYRIYGHGNDTGSGVVACVGDKDIITTGETYCSLLQVLKCGSSTYEWHQFIATINQDGYLYVNMKTDTSAVPKVERISTENTTVVLTDSTLRNTNLPANAKAVGNAIKVHGIKKAGTTYKHFVHAFGDTYIVRSIAPHGINGIYDYAKLETGHFENNDLVIDTTVWTAYTDQIGPISLRLTGETGDCKWTGGVHSIIVGETEYPTAQAVGLSVYVDGVDISSSSDGIYYGDATIIATNKLYAPLTITGADLSTATLAVTETRHFYATETLKVSVCMKFEADCDVALYYGMQHQDIHASNILLPTVGKELERSTISSGIISNDKEWRIMMENGNWHYDMVLDAIGIGTWNKNAGTGSHGRISHYSNQKIYYVLCEAFTASAESLLYWSGEYMVYHD